MKSTTTILLICSLLISTLSFAQTSTEQFEDESFGSSSFVDNGVIFNILSHTATFDIYTLTGAGWNGTANDSKFIDNTGTATAQLPNASFSIRTTSNLYKVNRFWVFLANQNFNQISTGTLTITGKLSGVTKFTQTKTTGFATSLGSTNGYTLIDMTNLNGQNYSNIIIDQLQLTVGGDYRYIGLDAFTWVKDSGIVLGANDVNVSKNKVNIYPNPTSGEFSLKAEENTKAEVYNQEGKLVKSLDLKKGNNEANISELPTGVYIIKTASESYKIIKK